MTPTVAPFKLALVRLLLALAAIAAMPAYAGSMLPCSQARVFTGAALNSFVLPYRYVGERATPELLQASRQISALVHFEILFNLLKYGGVGGTDLVAPPGEICDVDFVVSQVSGDKGPGSLVNGQTLLITWGRLFEEGDQLYIQSYLRFFRQGPKGPMPETLAVHLAGAGSGLNLSATLPAQAIAFAPRRISRADLARVTEEFKRAMVVRPQKDLNVPGQSIDFRHEVAFPYGVTRAEGDWMWLQPLTSVGPAGWVRARVRDSDEAGSWSLRRWLPELDYVDAVASFMRLRAGSPPFARYSPERARDAFDAGMRRFEAAVPAAEAPAAYGLARALRGFMQWEADTSNEGRAKAAELFKEAQADMPEYAAARNLAAVTRPLRAGATFDAPSSARLGSELVGALALAPGDAVVLDNLQRVYKLYADRPQLSPFDAREVKQRQQVIKAGATR
jgi:hypothetical protein